MAVTSLLVAVTVPVGGVHRLLANGGAFLLVPMYLLVFGLRTRQAVRTSLLAITVLAGEATARRASLCAAPDTTGQHRAVPAAPGPEPVKTFP